jgi:hypothetical protein
MKVELNFPDGRPLRLGEEMKVKMTIENVGVCPIREGSRIVSLLSCFKFE